MRKMVWVIVGVVLVALAAGGAYYVSQQTSSKSTDQSSSGTNSNSANTPASSNSSNGGSILQTKTDASLGQYLADKDGRPLYTYDLDTSGTSNCTGACLTNWPAYGATSTTNLPAHVTVITRGDGTKQYAYKGKPLYTFVGDTDGNVTGNGLESFTIAKP